MSYTCHEEGDRRFFRNCGTVKPTYKGAARDWNIFRYRQVIFIQVYQMWILGAPEPLDCKSASLKSGFRYSQVPFKTGLTVPVHHVLEDRNINISHLEITNEMRPCNGEFPLSHRSGRQPKSM